MLVKSNNARRREVKHTTRTTIYAALLLLALPRPVVCDDGLSADEQQLWNAAKQCSEAALRRYAVSSTEPAEKVAEAAFDKCKKEWQRLGEVVERGTEASAEVRGAQKNCLKLYGPSSPMCAPHPGHVLDYVRKDFVHEASIEVFDIRAEAAGK